MNININSSDNKNHCEYVGWLCTYVPEELIHAAGFFPRRILPHKKGGTKDKYLPPNFCPYVKNIIDEIESGENSYKAIVVTNSCNAMTHLYNSIRENFDIDVFLLHVPRKDTKKAEKYFTSELIKLKNFLENLGDEITPNTIVNSIRQYQSSTKLIKEYWPGLELAFPLSMASEYSTNTFDFFADLYHENREIFNNKLQNTSFPSLKKIKQEIDQTQFILLKGALPSRSLLNLIDKEVTNPVIMENCLSNRYLIKGYPRSEYLSETSNEAELLSLISHSYLSKPPCPGHFSCFQNKNKKDFISILKNFNLKAIIYHELNFCDYSNYDYLRLKNLLSQCNIAKAHDLPTLKLNTELEEQESGQFKTRLHAFLEIID